MTENEAIELLNKVMFPPEFAITEQGSKMKVVWDMAIQALEKIQQYRTIGTVEDCRVAVERMKPKKVKDRIDDYGDYFGRCPVCDRGVVSQFGTPYQYCPKCGIKLDWSE